MTGFRFGIPVLRKSTPQEWLQVWAAKYRGYDEKEYAYLIGKNGSLSAKEFERIGKWKDGVKTEGQWKANVASVAYLIWMQAALELPEPPEKNGVKAFLVDWSSRKYTDDFGEKGQKQKSFGLARATTLLHFVSGGRLPIFDSRVRKAIARLCNERPRNTVRWYVDSFCTLFSELALAARRKAICAFWTKLSSVTVRQKRFRPQTDLLQRRALLETAGVFAPQ